MPARRGTGPLLSQPGKSKRRPRPTHPAGRRPRRLPIAVPALLADPGQPRARGAGRTRPRLGRADRAPRRIDLSERQPGAAGSSATSTRATTMRRSFAPGGWRASSRKTRRWRWSCMRPKMSGSRRRWSRSDDVGLPVVAVQPVYCLAPSDAPKLRLLAAIRANARLARPTTRCGRSGQKGAESARAKNRMRRDEILR